MGVSISFLLLALVFEETRKETPKLVFKDQNLDSARNLLRQSLHQRLQTMDRVDGRRSMRGRSLHRQNDLESRVIEANQFGDNFLRRSSRSTLSKPSRPAPPPPLPKRNKNNTISAFTNIRNAKASTASQSFDLNSSLNGPNVNYESTTLIHIKNDNSHIKPVVPPKPAYLKKSQTDNGESSSFDTASKDASSSIQIQPTISHDDDDNLEQKSESNEINDEGNISS